MKISEVDIKNFRGYGENPNDNEGFYRFVDLDKYKFIIFNGYNGFGKTSFFDSIEWCLTDKLSRIEDKEKILMKNNLKRSHYLKFLNNTEKDAKREVEVRLKFDDGTKIIRKTKSSSLDEAKYESEFTDGEKRILTKNVLNRKLFENKKLKINSLLNTNFLGQENINRILRATSPSARTVEFMNLLGLSTLNDIVEKSKNSKSLSTIINNIKNRLDNIKKEEKELENQFTANGWGSFEEYINNVDIILEKLKNEKDNFKYLDKGKFSYLDNEYKNIKEYVDFTDSSVVIHGNLITEKNKLINSLQILLEDFLILRIFKENKKLSDMKAIKDIDIKALKNKEKSNEKILEVYRITYEHIYTESKKLLEAKDNIIDINIKNNKKVDDEVFNKLIIRYNNLIKFIEKYNYYIKVDYKNECTKSIVKINKLNNRNNKYINNIEKLSGKINEEINIINSLSKIEDSYKEVLLKIKSYLDNNNDDDIKCCPICLNKDFTDTFKELDIKSDKEQSIKNQLIKIIDKTFQSGNVDIEEHQNVVTKKRQEMKNLRNIYDKRIYKVIEEYVDKSKNYFDKIIGEVSNNVNKSLIRKEKHKKYYEELINKNNEDVNIYEKAYKNIFGEEINYENINIITDEEIVKVQDVCNKMIENYSRIFKKYNLKTDELNKRLVEIKEEIKNYSNLDINYINLKIKEINKVIELMKEIEKYKFNEINKKILNSYLKESENEKELNDKWQKYMDYQSDMMLINKRASALQENKLKELMESNMSIQWIYDKISPHPYFKKLEFKYENGSGGTKMTNIVSKENENMYLDHIFSSAQLNVLALSIFLGLSMNQTSVRFNQLYLDDPIQSMDDINILSFIDLLRCFIDSEDFKNDIILSTHDSNFAKLLMIKMRNKRYKIVNFEGYGSEGPIIE